jgi:hypothetical protein
MLSGNGAVEIDTGVLVLRGGKHRLDRLVAAVRAHEARVSPLPTGRRQHDVALYRSLRAVVEGREAAPSPAAAEAAGG